MWFHSFVVVIVVTAARAGDDASVHVHVESAPGPGMGMTLPLFNYYKQGNGIPPDPALAAAFSKWHGDEVHSQGPDTPLQQPPLSKAGSGEVEQHSHGPRPDWNYANRKDQHRIPRQAASETHPKMPHECLYVGPGNPGKPRVQASYHDDPPSGQWTAHYRVSRPNPRHKHSEYGVIPAWIMRKRQLRKYGVAKYLSPYTRIGVPAEMRDVAHYDENAEPFQLVRPRSDDVHIFPERLMQDTDYDHFYPGEME